MPCYVVETFLARRDAHEHSARERRARSAAERLARAGTEVCLDRAIHLPADEVCFFVVFAPSHRDVVLLAQRAGLDPLRITEAVSSGEEQHNA